MCTVLYASLRDPPQCCQLRANALDSALTDESINKNTRGLITVIVDWISGKFESFTGNSVVLACN